MNGFVFEDRGSVPYFRAADIPVRHGFSTRLGGISTEEHLRTLNLARGRGEPDENVKENFTLFCTALGIDPETLVSAHQIHSDRVLYVTPSGAGLDRYECDGFVTNLPGVALCVRYADCCPILLCDAKAGTVGAIHAGWRGAAAGIAYKGASMLKELGAKGRCIRAAVGPCIHDCCYEVGEDFRESLRVALGGGADRYIRSDGGSLYADIVSVNTFFLKEAGIPGENISVCPECTCCRPELFFSHRASGGRRGTGAAVISL